MKDKLINNSLNKIRLKYPEYTNTKLEEIKYGIESLYLTITKMIILIILSIIYMIAVLQMINITKVKKNEYDKLLEKILKEYDRLVVEKKNLLYFYFFIIASEYLHLDYMLKKVLGA